MQRRGARRDYAEMRLAVRDGRDGGSVSNFMLPRRYYTCQGIVQILEVIEGEEDRFWRLEAGTLRPKAGG